MEEVKTMELDIAIDYIGLCNSLIKEFCGVDDRELISELVRKNIKVN